MKVEVELHSLLNRLAGADCEFTAEDRQVVDNLTEDSIYEYQVCKWLGVSPPAIAC